MTWWKIAKAGDKVVCVNRSSHEDLLALGIRTSHPQLNEIVTVNEVFAGHDGDIVFNSVEYPAQEVGTGIFIHLDVDDFRPLEKRSTDKAMKALRGHLNTLSNDQLEDA